MTLSRTFHAFVLVTAFAAAEPLAAQERTGTPGPSQRESSGSQFDVAIDNQPSPPPADRPKYQLTRWLEDWRALADPAKRTDPFDGLKYISLSPSDVAHLTLSGQLREDLVADGGTLYDGRGQTYGLHRLYLGADLHVGQARIFAELADTLAPGERRPLGPTEADRLDAQLLFADYRLDVRGVEFVGRIGRQEIVFDPTQRFLGLREGPNNRQAFDAYRLNARSGAFALNLFSGRPVTYTEAVFDDHRNRAVSFRGVYATHAAGGQTQSFYVYGYGNDGARFGLVAGRERRTAYGARVAGAAGAFDYDFEGMRQTGTVGVAPIRAWAVGTTAGYTLASVPLRPRLGVQADFASGDRALADGVVGTFNPLFAKAAYFTEAPLFAYANIRHLKGSLSLRPGPADTLSLAYASFSKLEQGDVAYSVPLGAQVQTAGMVGHRLGEYVQFTGSHQFGRHFSLSLEAVHFARSREFGAVGGRDVDYAKVTANFLI